MHAILAEMVSGKIDTADLFMFVAFVLFALAAILAALSAAAYVRDVDYTRDPAAPAPVARYAAHPAARWAATVAYAGLACLALGFWVL